MSGTDAKRALRRRLRAERAAVPSELLRGWSAAVRARLIGLDAWRGAECVHLFIGSLPGEIETLPLLQTGLAQGKTVACPRLTDSGRLEHRRVSDPIHLTRGRFGLLEPDPVRSDPVDPAAFNLILVPGLAFDPRGHRLGLGGGYYDRFLSEANPGALRIGLAVERQISTAPLPIEPHDQPVAAIVTERRLIEIPRP